ncbi:MAG: asparagine synthetase A [Candidatus Bathyarchaeales archaeon]
MRDSEGQLQHEKRVISQEVMEVMKKEPIEIPRALEQLPKNEIEKKRCVGRIMTHALKCLALGFLTEGFEWLLPVIFSKSTDPLWPDPGASIEKRIEVEIYGASVRTTLSMIVHKMVACSLVHPKLFILSPNVRIERSDRARSGIHAYEFTQLDFEIRNATSQNVRRLVEKLLCMLIIDVRRQMGDELNHLGRFPSLTVPMIPFKVYNAEELKKTYGNEWETAIASEIKNPVWVTNIQREFYDFEDFETGEWDNYDLVLPGYGEVLSGARREWEYSKLAKKMERDGVKKENYKVLLKLAKEMKLKPSAGAGIGIERLVSWITGAKHIGETQLFPKIPGIVYEL